MIKLSYLTLCAVISVTLPQSLLDGVVRITEEGEEQIQREPQDAPVTLPEYDFIIVGAGTAGCVLANRLSENPNWNILLIEAGRTENYISDIPILVNYLQFTPLNWRYTTVPSEKFCLGLDNQQCQMPRGKVVGGSSVLNYMIYTRGNRRDYDNWAKLGNKGWSYEKVLPYFKKVENFTVNDSPYPSYHSRDGFLNVGYADFKSKLADAIIESSQQFGLKYVDYNGPTQVGVSRLQLSINDGVRESASRAYLHPVRDRPNLHLKKEAMVSRILIDPQTKQAQGVEFVKEGAKYVVKATKEVIVSAGAINSPQLLMLSGIGPKNHLKKMDIPVLSKLKVGYNLMDHIALGGFTFIIDKPYTITTSTLITLENMRDYLNHHKGVFTLPGGCEVLVFQDLKNPNSADGYPDMEIFFVSGSLVSDPALRRNFGVKDSVYKAVFEPLEGIPTYLPFPMLMRPKSKGRILLRSNDYKAKPLIFPNFLAHKDDIDVLVQGAYLTLNITKQPALQKLGARFNDLPLPQCASHTFASSDYFECMLRHFTFSIYHQCGTCKMGPPSDKSAVVDPRLRVYGIKRLRVIDASIMPEIPVAHLNSPTYMIAEKGADMIKEDWKVKT